LPHPGMGMMIPLILQHLLLVFGELKLAHRSDPKEGAGTLTQGAPYHT
jgi:hypothetical protein